jgi:hypothetical protein
MNGAPLWVTGIESLARGLPVLLVEGNDDATLIGHFLDQHASDWRQRLYLAPANGKDPVIRGVAVHRPAWVGIVDRDEWRQADVDAAAARSPRLFVLPRFCIESYLCDPDELWAALPATARARVSGNPETLTRPIYAALPEWVAHGAMWRVLRELYRTARLPAQLEDHPVSDEAEIRRILSEWHSHLAPDEVLGQYRAALKDALNLSPADQLHQYVHGMKFYNQVVLEILDHVFAGKGADDWLQKFRDSPIPPPADLRAVFDKILALVS